MTIKPCLKTILPLAAVAMFASASISNAAPVEYNLTSESDVITGTITLDLDGATADSNAEGVDTYIWRKGDGEVPDSMNPAITDFSIFVSGGTIGPFDTSAFKIVLVLELDDSDHSPVSLFIDSDATEPGPYLFFATPIDFATGEGFLDTQGGLTITNAALMPGSTTPVADLEIAAIDYDPDADTVTLTWRSRPNTTYKAFSSLDLSDWTNELADSLGPETEGIIVVGDLLTMSFPLTDGLENATDVFFRLEEE